MSVFAIIGIVIDFVAFCCGVMAGIFIFIGADRLWKYGAKLARRRKGR